MKPRVLYSVEPLLAHGHEVRWGELVHLEADSPTQAAEQVVGGPLRPSGRENRLRCRVWWLDDKFRTMSVSFYALE